MVVRSRNLMDFRVPLPVFCRGSGKREAEVCLGCARRRTTRRRPRRIEWADFDLAEVSRITLFDGRPVAKFDGLPGSTSRVL